MLGVQLPGTLVFDYPSVSAMAQYILSLMHPSNSAIIEEPTVLPTNRLAAMPKGTSMDHSGSSLISLQMCMRLPTGYIDDTIGDALACGPDSIRLVPFDRWDLEALRVRYLSVVAGVLMLCATVGHPNLVSRLPVLSTEWQTGAASPSWRILGRHPQV